MEIKFGNGVVVYIPEVQPPLITGEPMRMEVPTKRVYTKRKPKHYAETTSGGKLNWKSLNKLRDLKAAGMNSKDAAAEIGKSLDVVNAAWGTL